MKIDVALRCAVITALSTITITGCGSADPGSDAADARGSSATAPAPSTPSPTASTPTATPTPQPRAVEHSRIGPLLAPTQTLIQRKPTVTFQLEDTVGGEPAADAHGDLKLGRAFEALVYIDDVDGPRSLVLVDGKAFRNTGGAGEDAWELTDRRQARAEVEELAVRGLLPALAAGVTAVKAVGTVEEAGTSLVRYTFTADARKILDSLDLELSARTPRTMSGQLWVAADSGVLTRVHMAIGDFRHEVELQYGADVTVVAPPL